MGHLLDLLLSKISCSDLSISDMFVSGTKGERGEKRAERRLKLLNLCGKNGYVISNTYIPKSDGTTSEIDLIFITEKGLFVIESKNYSGWIFGQGTDRFWTQCFPNGKKQRFYNPILQNQAHIKWLSSYLQNNTIRYISLIVFSGSCTLKNVTYSQPDTYIVYLNNMNNTIVRLWNDLSNNISSSDSWEIALQLEALSTQDPNMKAKHIQQAQQFVSPLPPIILEQPASPVPQTIMICPWCGAPLVLRTARRGANAGNCFYGCSSYPQCKYIWNL